MRADLGPAVDIVGRALRQEWLIHMIAKLVDVDG